MNVSLLVVADGFWQQDILGFVRQGGCWFRAQSRAHLKDVWSVYVKRLQKKPICLVNFPEVALEILKLIPDCIYQYPAPKSGFYLG